jgi:hypothetical protein
MVVNGTWTSTLQETSTAGRPKDGVGRLAQLLFPGGYFKEIIFFPKVQGR